MPLRQHVRFCVSADGTRIAVASVGNGQPLVRAAHWLSHVDHDLTSPVWRPWLEELSRQHTYVRYDQRGCGLSDANVTDFSLDAWLADLEAVVASSKLRRFPLLGMSQGGAVAIAYAVRHPQRVSHLVLVGAYARGAMARAATPEERLEAETVVRLIRLGWGRDNAAFRQVFTHQFIPGGTSAQHAWWNELERLTATPENAARTLEAFHDVDVANLCSQLRVPTLVLHARGDARVPFSQGIELASLIPGARFVALQSDNHVLLADEPAWPAFLNELRVFLGTSVGHPCATVEDGGAALTPAEREVLRFVVRGLSNPDIAERLRKSEKTVRNQVSSIFGKLGVHTRAEAIVREHAREGTSEG